VVGRRWSPRRGEPVPSCGECYRRHDAARTTRELSRILPSFFLGIVSLPAELAPPGRCAACDAYRAQQEERRV
jgi:hypothetical protein